MRGEVRGGREGGREGGWWQLIYPGCVHSVFAPLHSSLRDQLWPGPAVQQGLSVSRGPPGWILPSPLTTTTTHSTAPHTVSSSCSPWGAVTKVTKVTTRCFPLAPGESQSETVSSHPPSADSIEQPASEY